ncbi:MAG: hypothetical protein R3Y57_01635 [Erysipelotrichaceae bacterium]
MKFFVDCTDEEEWKRRHIERLKNPLLHQSFESIEHVVKHYNKADINPFDDEYVIDTSKQLNICIEEVNKIVNTYKV